MTINTTELMAAITEITELQEIKTCAYESAKGGFITGLSAVTGGLLLGPIGLAIGGTVGGLTAAYMGQGKFKSLAEVIVQDMTPRQQKQLQTHIMNVVRDFEVTDVAMLLNLIYNEGAIRRMVINAVNDYAVKEMGLKLIK